MALPNVKNFQAIYEEIFRDVHNDTDTSINTFPDLTEVKKIYNDEYQKFVNARQWGWALRQTTFNMVDGTADYTLATDIREVHNMRIASTGKRLDFVPREHFERLYPKGTTGAPSGEPTMWTEIDPDTDNATKIRLRATPGASQDSVAVTVTYYKTPTNLSATSDIPIIPAQWQDVPIMYAKARCFGILDDDGNERRYIEYARDLEKKAFKEYYSRAGWVDSLDDVGDIRAGSSNGWPFWT